MRVIFEPDRGQRVPIRLWNMSSWRGFHELSTSGATYQALPNQWGYHTWSGSTSPGYSIVGNHFGSRALPSAQQIEQRQEERYHRSGGGQHQHRTSKRRDLEQSACSLHFVGTL